MSATLPAPLTRFVGRESELAEVAALLADARLLTLTGPGGAGKTRLALHLAETATSDFPDGVWFVDLSPLSGGEFVWDQVATTLGVTASGSSSALTVAVDGYLATRRALVVLDNCEHLVEAAAEVAAELVSAAPELKMITTSREPLGVGGEVTWPVPPLNDGDGMELFIDRARHARPDFTLRERDAEAVRSICHRLDGLPLAIELAAARTRAFAPADIAAGLRDRIELLPAGPRTAPARQATLRASFDWSHELLSEDERALLRQCSVFAGGFDLDAAIAVCPAASLEVLGGLVDRSLLLAQDDPARGTRHYRMLEPIRQFAAKHLAEANEITLIRGRHRDYFLGLAETAEPLLSGPDEDRWRARLSREMDNMRAALAWSRDQGDAESLARMVTALVWFWAWPGRIRELAMWFEAAAAQAEELSPRMRARVRNFQCVIALVIPGSGKLAELPAMATEALALARASGDKRELALALGLQAMLWGLIGGSEAMGSYLEEFLPLARAARSTGFGQLEALALSVFSLMRFFQSDPDETRRLAEEAVAVAKDYGDHHTNLFCKSFGAFVALSQGRLADARQLFEATVTGGRQTNDSNYLHSLLGLAWVDMFEGDFVAANEAMAECLTAVQKVGADSNSITSVDPHAMMIRGWMHLAVGDSAQASQELASVLASIRTSIIAGFTAVVLAVMAEAQLATGEPEEAAAFLDEAASLAEARKLTWILGRVALVRAKLRGHQGQVAEAESLSHQALGLARDAGDQLGLADALEFLARLATERDSHREAARLWAAADSQRHKIGYARFPVEQGPYEAAVAQAKQAISQNDFAAAWAEGAKLTVEEAIAYAARGRGERKRPTAGWASLTPSELEVAKLVGEHLTNPEIAKRLFVSRATVKTHLVHIFTKLSIDSRSELAAEAVKRNAPARTGR